MWGSLRLVPIIYIYTNARLTSPVWGSLRLAPTIIKANIPVQELEGQRREGAYFREDHGIIIYHDI